MIAHRSSTQHLQQSLTTASHTHTLSPFLSHPLSHSPSIFFYFNLLFSESPLLTILPCLLYQQLCKAPHALSPHSRTQATDKSSIPLTKLEFHSSIVSICFALNLSLCLSLRPRHLISVHVLHNQSIALAFSLGTSRTQNSRLSNPHVD